MNGGTCSTRILTPNLEDGLKRLRTSTSLRSSRSHLRSPAFPFLRDTLGFWPAVALVILVPILLVLLVGLILRPQQRKRVTADAERGLFECAHREKGSALRGRWALGYARAEPGKLVFQQKTGVSGPLAGPVEVYPRPRVISEPVKASWGVFSGGKVVELATDRGEVELAASDASLQMLIERTESGN